MASRYGLLRKRTVSTLMRECVYEYALVYCNKCINKWTGGKPESEFFIGVDFYM